MISLYGTAFVLGALGSTHCIGMCGPIAWSLPLHHSGETKRFAGTLLYNGGRIVTYMFIGLLTGWIGQSILFTGIQHTASILIGSLILLFLLLPKLSQHIQSNRFFQPFYSLITRNIGLLYRKKTFLSYFLIGFLNGWLPCGLVYMAVAGAVLAGTKWKSILFMLSFGLGTLPLMWAFSFFGQSLGVQFRRKIRMVFPIVLSVMAITLILRGLGIDMMHNLAHHQPLLSKSIIECAP